MHVKEDDYEVDLVNLNCLGIVGLEATHIIEKNDALWIGSTNGVIIYNEKEKTCTIDSIFEISIPHTIQFLHQDKSDTDIIWLGTRKGGLIKWNTSSNQFKTYDTSNGLSNNDVHAILEDSKNRLWISTNRFLNCLDKNYGTIYTFTEQDGISHSEFNRSSYFYDDIQNTMYFGGLNGYTYFSPDSIKTREISNDIELRFVGASKIKEDATQENILPDLQSTNSIKFYEEDVSFQLALSTNHLYHPDKINYSYRIPGLFEEWRTQNTNIINLNRLPYGEYTLELVSDLNKPSFKSSILSLELNVIKPFKKTWPAYVLSFLISIFLMWFAVKKYFENIKNRNINLERMIAERTHQLIESNRTKNKLFAILAHDLKNPISSLSNIAEKIKFLTKRNRLDEIDILSEQTKKQITSLDNNLNNILMWATSENNMLVLEPEKLSLYIEIQNIINLYSNEINRKNLNISIKLIDLDQVFVSLNVLQTLLRNFINNAIKFSYEQGDIKFEKKQEDRDRLVLKIEDNGIGLETKGDYETQRQKHIREEGKGSGIGLKIARELSDKAGIQLEILKNDSGGTTVLIDMPKR